MNCLALPITLYRVSDPLIGFALLYTLMGGDGTGEQAAW